MFSNERKIKVLERLLGEKESTIEEYEKIMKRVTNEKLEENIKYFLEATEEYRKLIALLKEKSESYDNVIKSQKKICRKYKIALKRIKV